MEKLLYFFELKEDELKEKSGEKSGEPTACENREFFCKSGEVANGRGIIGGVTNDGVIIYRVEENENLEKIAFKFNCPPSVIVSENNLKNEVSAGDLLAIKTGFAELYRIKLGDDIVKLTELANLSVNKLLEINRVSYFYPWQLIALGEKN